jgi:hypothetical protein
MAWRRGYAVAAPAYLPPETPRSTSPEDEKRYLSEELEYLEKEAKAIKTRMGELDAEKK